nr:pyrethroid hydrolase Ces2a [Biomphalaria glabrata]
MPLLLLTADDGVLLLQGAGGTNSCWHNVFKASLYGPICVQPQFDDVDKIVGSEDCLYLDVWAPSLAPKELLPEMVWIRETSCTASATCMACSLPQPRQSLPTPCRSALTTASTPFLR